MNLRLSRICIALACLAAVSNALADCAADATVADVRSRYDRGVKLEREGKADGAFAAFVAAQEYTCDPNPVELDAARRAAPLAAQLGAAAEQKRDFEKAFEIYEAGGHYALADRALMALVRAQPDSPDVFAKARSVLEHRALPSFQSNNEVRLGVTGAYRPDPKNLAEVLAMPAKGAERAFQKEAAAFNEQHLRELVELTQALAASDPTDFEAMQAAQARQQAFAQKWPQEPLKASHEALQLIRSWASAEPDKAVREKIEARRDQVISERIEMLMKRYSGAPKLIEEAITYQLAMNLEHAVRQQRAAALRTQAEKLGDDAYAKQQLLLAAEYYSIADQREKAQAARDKQQRIAMARMQPSIEAAQKQAAELEKQFSDPEAVKAMQAQAEAMRKSLEAQQKANAASNAKSADELEKELGL